jgi:hypothetical protein
MCSFFSEYIHKLRCKSFPCEPGFSDSAEEQRRKFECNMFLTLYAQAVCSLCTINSPQAHSTDSNNHLITVDLIRVYEVMLLALLLRGTWMDMTLQSSFPTFLS